MRKSSVQLKLVANDTGQARFGENEWRAVITSGVQQKVRSGTRMKDIVAATGLCQQTVSNLVHGETKFPRMDTVVRVMRYLGYKLYAEI